MNRADNSFLTPIRPPFNQPLKYIDEEDDLMIAIEEMSTYTEIAIDLEHHSLRSFMGITCLMQVSY